MRGFPGISDDGREPARLEAFSDAVIAIAMTLLVLEIKVPAHDEDHRLWSQLGDLWPSYLGFLLSFVVIGIMWANHHELFSFVSRVDRWLVLLNLHFLLCIAFIPFPTGVLAEYLGHTGEGTAIQFYAGSMFVCAVVYNLLWMYPRRAGLISPDADPTGVRNLTRAFTFGPPTYLFALVLAFIWPVGSLIVQALLALSYLIPPRWFDRKRSSASRV